MTNIQLLRREVGLKFKGNRLTGEINVHENKRFTLVLREN
jgi:ABC-type ATPase involved in cell division